MAKLIILSETTKQMTEKAVHASRAEGSKSSFNYEIVLIEALKLLRRQPGGGFCSKRLYSGRGWNVFSGTAYTITQVQECAFQLAGFILSKASLAAVAVDAIHLMLEPWHRLVKISTCYLPP